MLGHLFKSYLCPKPTRAGGLSSSVAGELGGLGSAFPSTFWDHDQGRVTPLGFIARTSHRGPRPAQRWAPTVSYLLAVSAIPSQPGAGLVGH